MAAYNNNVAPSFGSWGYTPSSWAAGHHPGAALGKWNTPAYTTPAAWNSNWTPASSWATPLPNAQWPATAYGTPAVWSDFDRSIRYFERELENMKQSAERAFSGYHAGSRPYSTELASFPSRPTSLLEHYSFLNPIRIDINGNRWLNCCFDLRTFKPEEIKVALNTKERCVHVEADHEVKDTKEHYVRRHYNRKYFIPEDLKVDLSKLELKSFLTTEGLLYVEAALPKLTEVEMREEPASKHNLYGSHFGYSNVLTYPVSVKRV